MSWKPFGWLVTRLVNIVAVVSLVGAGARGAQLQQSDPAWMAPPDAAERANPLAHRTDVVAGGGKLFHQRCASCHGDDAQGTHKAPDLLAKDVQTQSDGALFWKITQGNTRAGMPTFSFLAELQRWQLVMHLRSLRRPLSNGSRVERKNQGESLSAEDF